jgi:hypothetical protein
VAIAIARQQGNFQRATATTHAQTISGTVVGQRLVLLTITRSGTAPAPTVSSATGTWTSIGRLGVSSSGTIEWWECRDATTSLTTITVTFSSTQLLSMRLFEITGSDMTVASTGTGVNDATSDTAWTAGPHTPTAGVKLLIAGMGFPSTSTSRTVTAVSSGWSAAAFTAGSSTVNAIGTSTQIVTADGSTAYSNVFTGSGTATVNIGGVIAIPEAASSGGLDIIASAAGAVSVAAPAATFAGAFDATATAAAVSVAAPSATLTGGMTLTASAASIAVAGQDAIFTGGASAVGLDLTANTASVTVGGVDATMTGGADFLADAAAFSITGQDAIFTSGMMLDADAATVLLGETTAMFTAGMAGSGTRTWSYVISG